MWDRLLACELQGSRDLVMYLPVPGTQKTINTYLNVGENMTACVPSSDLKMLLGASDVSSLRLTIQGLGVSIRFVPRWI